MVTPEQFVAIMAALTAFTVAIGGVFLQLRQTHHLVNSRMTELLEVTKSASAAEGNLAGRAQLGDELQGVSIPEMHRGQLG